MHRFDLEYSLHGRFTVEAATEEQAKSMLEEHLRDNNIALKQANLDIHTVTESCANCDE